jgi:DNA-binding NarL/FixJ family response regulator
MPPFREVVFVTARPRRLGHLRKILRAVRVTSHVRVMDPRQWCDTPEARRERLVFLDAASAPPREALIAARASACGSRLVLCCKTPAPEVAQTAMECGLDGVLSANLPPEDAARALQQICRGERQFRFEAPSFRRAPAASSSTNRPRPTVSFSAERIAPAASPAQRPSPGAHRGTPAISFAPDRLALTAPAPRTAPRAPSAARTGFDALWMFGASEA